jgi:hypothetical protein
MLRVAVLMTCLVVGACAPLGSAYDIGGFVPRATDACVRPETIQSMINFLNAKIGQPGGPPARVLFALLSFQLDDRISVSAA